MGFWPPDACNRGSCICAGSVDRPQRFRSTNTARYSPSRYVAAAVAFRLAEQDRELREADATLNACPDIREMENELDALPGIESEYGDSPNTMNGLPLAKMLFAQRATSMDSEKSG